MSRLPIRWRLTAAFALAMVLVLAAAAVFVYLRLADDLNESVETSLRARAEAVSASGDVETGAGEDTEESFAQVVSPSDGRVLDSVGGPERAAISGASLVRAGAGGSVLEELEVPGIEGTARVLAAPADEPPGSVVIVGQSLDDRDETLAGLVASFAIGGPIAVLAASLLGYLLAASALRPVEEMRRRAGEISLTREEDRLPLPAAHDEIRRLGVTLNEMLGRMHESYERERRFVADASHELRTPLAVLKAELEGSLSRDDLSAETRESVGAALAETDQLAQLADDLLLIARSGDRGLPVAPERVDVRELLEQARHRFAERAGSQGRAIELDSPDAVEAQPRSAAHAAGARQPRRQRASPRLRVGRARGALARWRRRDRRERRGRGLPGRALRAGLRALHARGLSPHSRRRRARPRDRGGDRKRPRRRCGDPGA